MFEFLRGMFSKERRMKKNKANNRRNPDPAAHLDELPTRYGIILIGNNTLTVKFDPKNPLRYQAIGSNEWLEEPYILVRDIPMGKR